ncbi:di-heme-cytochrome C peroxidase [Simiduia curdlanivorans]|uniref:Di-heme-cytochrome C peroxidase n=1 Tax=Simiduia curdlanivorans TaxID=1492769 RepID=A0ABV8V159_9GAMM|nr:di-heme-cytochrome C peroxidase [Simiduia curdlanivorans]MDN3639206.1 di-heme-cytochrome C peroxidase [Simiduia curdlanivorans]
MSSQSHDFGKMFSYLKRALLAFVALVIIWAAIGAGNRAYHYWDNQPNAGALVVEQDRFGDEAKTIAYLEQGWGNRERLWFYNTSQGSNLLPMSFALNLKHVDDQQPFFAPAHILRYRYLPQQVSSSNPYGLPVGMTLDSYKGKPYFGFTCAACHTTQINYQGLGIRIDGGPALADMENFMLDLGRSLEATLTNADLLSEFTAKVLEQGDYDSAEAIQDELEIFSQRIGTYNLVNKPRDTGRALTHYGYARLDAFGRIYNRVLEHLITKSQLQPLLEQHLPAAEADDLIAAMAPMPELLRNQDRDFIIGQLNKKVSLKARLKLLNDLFNPADAPVSYPFLWDIPHHDYVQWNGIVQNAGIGPLGRNAGQVIGVFGTLEFEHNSGINPMAFINKQSFSKGHIEFTSSLDIRNLRLVEKQLKSLMSPQWPEQLLGAIDRDMAAKGRKHFVAYCASCHDDIVRDDPRRRVVAKFSHYDKVATDNKMAANSVEFSGGSGIVEGRYVDTEVGDLYLEPRAPIAGILSYTTRNVILERDPDKTWVEWLAERAFDFLLTVNENEVKPSIKRGDYSPNTMAKPYESLRAYKARPLNGIWATAPYLHNGSVPTLYDLLLPACTADNFVEGECRPNDFVVGSREFDPRKVGFRSQGYSGFAFNTAIYGNYNTGHEYAAGKTAQPNGQVLPALDDAERMELLEYLKTL